LSLAAAARVLTGAGVVAALPAAASGADDWFDTAGGEQRVGVAHALLNATATTLFAGSWWQRRRGRHGTGAALGVLGGAAVAAAGYLGGDLAYRAGVGVNTTAFQSGPTEWRPVAAVAALRPGRPHGVRVDGVALVAVADDRLVVAVLEDRCTHRGGPLHEGTVVDGCIECPWHGSRFRLSDGSVAVGPASVPQPVYGTRTRDGQVEVKRDEHGALRRNVLPAEQALAAPFPG
jgi:nitrite reductase/ring-hydroxylating ferredoxin subunit